ncbi:threonine aldolase family protein [Arvimicrobium flavum]|uniref:threonine aldolase family protein n=1 Tax=Arvimicrobium flavum TaxID=3393320 RepID=UPI00237A6BE3|nr:low specificity L-threonine aldolase [Mesorhizobium shangrilense]
MIFASDNWAGAHPAIAASLAEHATGYSAGYGAGELDKVVDAKFSELFEREVAVLFVGTGTAANSLALTSVAKPGGIVFAHAHAHVIDDECGAPEYLSGGLRISPVEGGVGKMTPAALRHAIGRFADEFVHAGRPNAVSLTQATEAGSVYALDEIAALSAIAKEFGLPVHMDGARFANALVSLGCTPAEMTWKRGVDLLSFGGTKNGCWCAEAIVLFDPSKAKDLAFVRKRAAQLFSKSRFIAAQFDAYFRDGLWLQTARHANAMAVQLAGVFRSSNAARLAWEPQANEVFAILSKPAIAAARSAGAVFYEWNVPEHFDGRIGEDEELCRFVTSFATTTEDVARFAQLIRA